MVPVEDPPERVKATANPPLVRALSFASLAVKVRVEFDPEAMVLAETLMSELANENPPGVTVTVGSVEVSAEPLIVAAIVVADPAVVPVKEA